MSKTLLCAIMDSSAMAALSVCCSPEGGPLTDPLHNAGNCLLRRDSADVGTECEINLAMISLICSQWLPPQVKGAARSRSIHSSDWLPSRPLVALSAATLMAALSLRQPPRYSAASFCVFFPTRELPTYNVLPSIYQGCAHRLMAPVTFSGPRRYRSNRYESHLEPASENASRCFIKNKKYWFSFIRMDCSLIRFLRNWKCSVCLQSIGFRAVIISAQEENKYKQTITTHLPRWDKWESFGFDDFGRDVLSNIKLTPHPSWKFTYLGSYTGFLL